MSPKHHDDQDEYPQQVADEDLPDVPDEAPVSKQGTPLADVDLPGDEVTQGLDYEDEEPDDAGG